jgi:hypothetical protein
MIEFQIIPFMKYADPVIYCIQKTTLELQVCVLWRHLPIYYDSSCRVCTASFYYVFWWDIWYSFYSKDHDDFMWSWFLSFVCDVGQRLRDDTGRSTGIDTMETAGVLALALQQQRTLQSFHFYRKLK